MIPKNWNNITTEQFMRFDKAQKEEPQTSLEKIDLMVKKACILTGMDELDVMNMNLSELSKVDVLASTPIPQKIYETFKLGDINYEVIKKPNKLNAYRYAGVMEASKKNNLYEVLYFISRPFHLKGLKREYFEFEAWEVPERINDFKNLPITISHPIAAFFLRMSNECTNFLQGYSIEKMREMRKMLEEAKTDIQGLTDGLK